MQILVLILIVFSVVSSIRQSKLKQQQQAAENARRRKAMLLEAEKLAKASTRSNDIIRPVLTPTVTVAGATLNESPDDSVSSHVVQPFTESAHAHTESSMTGVTECEEQNRTAYVINSEAKPELVLARSLPLDERSVVRGILYAEILGKPKALRR